MHVCVQVHACGDAPVMHTHEAIAALAMAVIATGRTVAFIRGEEPPSPPGLSVRIFGEIWAGHQMLRRGPSPEGPSSM